MIQLAIKEIYRIGIKVSVDGDDESKKKLTATEKMAEQTKKKVQALDKITASPSAKLKDNASSTIDKIKSKSESLNKTTSTAKIKAEDNASKDIDKVTTKAENLNKKSIKAKVNADGNAKNVVDEVDSKADKLNKKNVKVKVQAEDEATKTINKIENKINGWIKTGAKKIISIGIAGSVALGGIGLSASVKEFVNFEQGLSNVKAVTEATDEEMKELSNTAKELGASTAWSALDVTQAEELLGQAGFTVQETITALPGLLSLASAGSLDLAAATDIASGTLRSFGLNVSESSHVADVLALSAAATNSDVADLGDTMKYVAPVSASLGISLEDTAAAAGLLSNQNIKGSQAGTVLRQTMARLAGPTDEAAKLMKKYSINAFDSQGNMKSLNKVVDNLNSSLGDLTSQERADIISTIFGTESMSGVLALMNQGGESLSDLSNRLKESKGAADKMAETKLDNLAGQWEELSGAVDTMKINLGERLAPYAKDFVAWLISKMPEVENKVMSTVDYLSNNIDKIKSISLSIAGIGVAFSGISAVGSISNTFTSISGLVKLLKGAKVAKETTEIATGLSKIGVVGKILPALLSPAGLAITGVVATTGAAIAANNSLMKKSVSTTVEELGPLEKIMNVLNGNLLKSKKEMVELGLVYDDFGSGISDSFKNSAEEASKSLLKIEMDINRLVRDDIFDDADNTQLRNWVNEFVDEGVDAIRRKKSEIQSEFEKTFNLDGVTSESEQGVMDYLSSYFEEGVNKQLSIRDEIYEIGDKAIQDHGAILDSDMKLIKEKLAELQALKLEYAEAENIKEQAYARSKFASQAEKVSGIDGASELLQERATDYNSNLDEIKANYDGSIAQLNFLIDKETDSTKKAVLQKGLEEATVARDKALEEARSAWESDLATLYEAYPKAKGMINEENGKVFDSKDLKLQKAQKRIEDSHPELANITESGVYALKNNTTQALETLFVSIDEQTGKIKGLFNAGNGLVGAYSEDQKEKLLSLQEEYLNTGSAIQQLVNSNSYLNANTNEVVSSLGDTIGQLQNVQISADGTKTGIIDLNGTPIEITSDVEGHILSMREYKGSIDDIPESASTTIETNANEAKGEIEGTSTAINNMPESKTVTITTIVKKIYQTVKSFFGGEDEVDENADGTSFASEGFSTVDERGWELSQSRSVPIIGEHNDNPLTYMSQGTKILNHMQSVQDMKAEVSRQVNRKVEAQPKQQMQYQLIKPQQQVQVAGIGGISFGDVNVNVDGTQDMDNIIAQATQEFALKLKESLSNIKK